MHTENCIILPTLDPLIQLPLLQQFNASGFPLRMMLAQIKCLGALEYLGLQNTTLEGRTPQMLGDIVDLHSINLSRNNLWGKYPMSWEGQLRLSSWIYLNNIMIWFPEFILNVSHLVSLNLLGNNFFGQIPSTIGKFSTLLHFFVRSSLLEGETPCIYMISSRLNDILQPKNIPALYDTYKFSPFLPKNDRRAPLWMNFM